MIRYFSHDVGAQFDDKCIKLIRELGYEGYGLFWALVERMVVTENCELPFSISELAWSLHADETILRRVICKFGLFTFSDDKTTFWSDAARKRVVQACGKKRTAPAEKTTEKEPEKRKRGRPRKNPLPDVPPQPEELPATIEAEAEPPAEPTDDSQEVVDGDEQAFDEDCSQPNLGEQVIELWNNIFNGTKQVYKGLALDAISFQRMKESYTSGFTIHDLAKAFKVARADKFSWLLRDVLKAENIQRLLSKDEKQHELQNNRINKASPSWELPPDLQTDAWS